MTNAYSDISSVANRTHGKDGQTGSLHQRAIYLCTLLRALLEGTSTVAIIWLCGDPAWAAQRDVGPFEWAPYARCVRGHEWVATFTAVDR